MDGQAEEQLVGHLDDGPAPVGGLFERAGPRHRLAVGVADLDRDRPRPQAGPTQPGGDRVGEPQHLAVQVVDVGQVLRERDLVADRLGGQVGHHRPVVDGVGERVEVLAVGPADRCDERVERERGQVPDSGHPHVLELGERLGSDPPQRRDVEGVEERQLVAGAHLVHAGAEHRPSGRGRGLGLLGRELGQELRRCDAHRAGQAHLVEHLRAQPGRDLGALPHEATGTRHVEERLVERQRLHERGEGAEQLHDLARDLRVEGVVAVDEHGVRATPPGNGRGQRRVDPEGPGLVARCGHHAPVPRPADHDRPAP